MRRLEIPLANSLRPSETFASLRETGVRHWGLAGNQVSRRDAKASKERKESIFFEPMNSPAVSLDAAVVAPFAAGHRLDNPSASLIAPGKL